VRRAGPPRDAAGDHQLLGGLLDPPGVLGLLSVRAVDAEVGVEDVHRDPHAGPDRLPAAALGEPASEPSGQGEQGLAPVLLGLDEGAVHVEEDGAQFG
jgi:hypothetical protein